MEPAGSSGSLYPRSKNQTAAFCMPENGPAVRENARCVCLPGNESVRCRPVKRRQLFMSEISINTLKTMLANLDDAKNTRACGM